MLVRPLHACRYAHLNLSRNNFGGPGLMALCAGLTSCQTLKVINLSSTGITEEHLGPLQVRSQP